MLSALVAQVVEHRRSALRDLVIVRYLAVEQAHRIAHKALLTGLAEFRAVRLKISLQRAFFRALRPFGFNACFELFVF